MASLVVMGPPATGARFPLASQREFVIGRSGFCDIVLNKRSVSREHAKIFESQGEFFIADLQSVNGTFVNGRPIDENAMRLKDGDRINVYDVPLTFHLFEDAKPPPSSGTIPVFTGSATGKTRESPESQLRVQLDNILDIVHQFGNSLDVGVILPNVLDILFRSFPQSSNGEILLVEYDGTLSPRATKYGHDVDPATMTAVLTERRLAQQILETGVPQIIVTGDATGTSALESVFSSTMFVPILIGTKLKPMGIIVLETEDPQSQFTELDLGLVGGVATIVAQAIRYAHAHMVVVEHQKTQHHLEMARQIQLQMLPRDSPRVDGFSFAHYYRAAQLVGGDAYSYHRFRDGRIMLAVADASGKGLPASLRIAQFISELRHSVCTAPSLKSAMSELNAFVCQSEEGFITFCLAILDPRTNTLTIANAGHPLPTLRHRDGTVIPVGLNRVSLPLGLTVDNPFHPIAVELEVGDEFLFFTDGITEAFGPTGAIYGTERLYKRLQSPAQSAVERIRSVVEDVENFRRGRDPSDDQCLLAIRRE